MGSSKTSQQMIQDEVFFGVVPLSKKDKIYGFWDIFLVTAGYAIATYCYIQGATVSQMMPLASVIFNVLGGNTMGLLSLVCIGFANITTQSLTMYVMTVSTKMLNPKWNYKVICTIWSIYTAVFLATGLMWKAYTLFVAIVGLVSAPAIGLMCVDFFLVRKQKVSIDAMYMNRGNKSYYYTKGFNLVGFGCFFAGILAFLLVYNPIISEPRNSVFLILAATGTAMATSALLYFISSKIPPSVSTYFKTETTQDCVS